MDWNEQDKAEQWRKARADITNKYLEENSIQEKVDHRSYQRQGIEQISTIHYIREEGKVETESNKSTLPPKENLLSFLKILSVRIQISVMQV